jgi:F0F1-type ATP synthase assembly protein I
MPDDKPGRPKYRALSEGLTLAFLFPAAIVTGFLFGHWLDGKFGLDPWMTIVFTVLGVAAAFVQLFRISKRTDDRPE